jgi:hypothetical protein
MAREETGHGRSNVDIVNMDWSSDGVLITQNGNVKTVKR